MLEKYQDIVSGAILLIIGLILFFASQTIPVNNEMGLGANLMPKLMSLLLLIFGGMIMIQGYAGLKACGGKTFKNPVKFNYKAVFLSLSLLGVYILFLNRIGFLIMTVLYTFLQMKLFAPKEHYNFILFAIISLVATGFIYLVFVNVFSLMLPAGILG